MLNKTAALFLSIIMAMIILCIPAAMADSSAASGSTASLVENAAANGLLAGLTGELKPEENLTRAQMASILDCAFGAAEEAPMTGFTDVDPGAWYYGAMAKAVQMGTFALDAGTLDPEGAVTREDVFLALNRVFKPMAADAAVLDGLKDKDSLSPDAQVAAAALLQAGYISAGDGYLNPKAPMTAAEFLQILSGRVNCYISQEGTYASVPDGGVMINVPEVTLKDMVVKGDLILGDGVGDGSVTLDNVTVSGRTLIRGGGAHSIRITGGSNLQNIVIARVNGELRVFAEDGTEIGEVFVDGKDDVTIEGNVGSVTLASDDVTVMAVNAQIGSASVTGENSRIIVGAGSSVDTLTLDGANAAAEVSGTVTDIVVNGGGAAISGEGRVGNVEANANNTVVTTPDTLVTAAVGTSGVIAGTRSVSEGTTVNTTPEYDGGADGEKPAVTSVAPAQGAAEGGTAVTITGKYFTGATSVTFGGKAAVSFKIVSDTSITAVTPAGTPGAAVVTVTTSYGNGSKAAAFTYVAAPAVASVSPAVGPAAGGTNVTITGTGFTGATSVTVGGAAAASFTVNSDTSITAVTPAGTPGAAVVVVTTGYGNGSKAAAFTYVAAPTVASVSPAVGPAAGGMNVTITGAGFMGATSVTVGGAPAASFTVNSNTSITAVTPAGTPGAAVVAVTTAYGNGSKAAAFTYVAAPAVSSVSPDAGAAAGGTAVTVTGTGFTGATSVTVGGAPAASFTVNSDTSITAVTPAGAPGAAVVAVTTACGNGSKAVAFTYVAAPAVDSVSPAVGPAAGGMNVTITGTGFTGATSVTMGGAAAASFTVNSDTSITAVTPAGTVGTADIVVTTPGGTFTSSAAFTYMPAPVVSAVLPGLGQASGGTAVIIQGIGFTGATSVTFDGIPAPSFTVIMDEMISAVTPGCEAGPADVAVTAAGGTGTLPMGYTYIPVPSVTSAFPDRGPAAGGTTVSIAGTGFTGASSVNFGISPASSFTVVSDALIMAVAPGSAAGAHDVSVTTIGGTGVKAGAYTYVLPPIITGLSASMGPAAGGNTVTITGTVLSGATSVTFGTNPAASFTVESDTQITAVAPAGDAGTVNLTVITAGGQSPAYPYVYAAQPAVASITPDRGTVAGGTTAAVTGSNFLGVTAVTFGGAPAVSFTVNSDTQITAVTPAGIAGTADVAVTAAGGTGTKTGAFTYVPVPQISSVTPGAGALAGGNTVTIAGTGFTGTTAVDFDISPASAFTVNSDTQITAVVPAGSGTVQVTVTTAGGTSNGVSYIYVPAPAITFISPNQGAASGGTAVIITGTGFTGASSAAFGSTPAVSLTVVSDTEITATAPAGSGTVQVTVTTAGGTSNGASYTYVPAPAIVSVSPSVGTESGGTAVTITGTGLMGASSVAFGSTPAVSFTVVSDTLIVATAPAGTGIVPITVTTAGGTSNGVSYTYVAVPVVGSVSPSQGTEFGGTSVLITGTGFTGAASVAFGSTPAVSLTVVSNTEIIAIAPAGSGTVQVTVTTAGGTSNGASYTYVPAPAIVSVSPSVGTESGGTAVTITGTGLMGASSVAFGSTPAVSFTVVSDTLIVATAPAGTGIVPITVTTAGGTSNAIAYTYIPAPDITSISPDMGPFAGGNTVTIQGSNLSGATSVKFGTAAASITVVSDTQISATVPAGLGTVDISVTSPGGTVTRTAAYTYVPVPAIASITPDKGPESGGNTVTINGTGFTSAGTMTVTVDGNTASITGVQPGGTSMQAEVPGGAAGSVDIVLTTPGGQATAAGAYTYVLAPEIISVSPNAGTAAGGTSVTITGYNFSGATNVSFGGNAASFSVISGTQITATTPAGSSGTVDVAVTTAGGTAIDTGAYTYLSTPAVSTVSPASGYEYGGTPVTITGTGFTGATTVYFGGAPATNVTVDSDTQITALTPAGSGTVDVVVANMYFSDTKTNAYTYLPIPTIYFLDPSFGNESGGTSVSITGSGFTGATAVSFGSTFAITFTVVSDTKITAVTPAGSGVVDVTVVTAGGTGTASSAFEYMKD